MSAVESLQALLQLMVRLRDPVAGCPWDRAQDFGTIAPYTIEEAYELADAIARNEPAAIREELGDLLFQVVFHARLAEERGWFDFAAVASGIHDKLVQRHPHVFAGAKAADDAQLSQQWEQGKSRERAARGQGGTLDGIATALPALTRAAKLGKRAAGVGFDWPDVSGVRAKIDEELAEVEAAGRAGNTGAIREEVGDLLFTVVNLARHLRIDPEAALQEANRKFAARFAHMEQQARTDGRALAELSAEDWNRLWESAKS